MQNDMPNSVMATPTTNVPNHQNPVISSPVRPIPMASMDDVELDPPGDSHSEPYHTRSGRIVKTPVRLDL